MKTKGYTFYTKLFYSYSHKDGQYINNLVSALSHLKNDKLLEDWFDQKILSGQIISQEIKEKMNEADIFLFLLSSDFIGSDACKEEWEYAKQLSDEGKPIFRIPIILRDCAWIDFLGDDNIKALPKDGKPIANFDQEDTAWLQVYHAIKEVINELRRTFIPKIEFIQEIEETGFVSLEHVKLQDIFVFPRLSYYPPQAKDGPLGVNIIEDQKELLAKKYVLIHGREMSGKSSLGRYLFLSLTKDMSTPVLHIDLKEVPKKPYKKVVRVAYQVQFNGDYDLWQQQEGKILILDNLSSTSNSIEFIEFAKDNFDKIIITLPSNVFYSFFRDEERLADFHELQIEPLNRRQQEELIRKRLALSDRAEDVTDGLVDQIEDRVNSIVISQKIVPRYPFFVLSILQTYEGFMPNNLTITAYGHCYNVLIVTRLIKAGISSQDNDLNACFNFAEELAFKIYQNTKKQNPTEFNFGTFVKKYREKFVISDSILSRLRKIDYGIITENARFRSQYMYYFFLGSFLAKGDEESKNIIEQMCEHSHVYSNYLTLLFIIHHTNDSDIIDDILLRTMCTLDSVQPAKLTNDETNIFKGFINDLPENILSNKSVDEVRKDERNDGDINQDQVESTHESDEPMDEDPVNDIYLILKNNEIMGQILRNKYGSLEKSKIEEIVDTVGDSGLRLVKILLVDEKWITDEANYLQKKYPNHNIEDIKKFIQFLSFLWTMGNIRKIVSNINVPEIRDIINEIVQQKSTPAYDLIGYFNHLDSVEKLTNGIKRELETLLKEHDDYFLQRVLSLETQYYMNTHRSDASIEQSICSLLNIKYTYKLPKD